MTPALPELVALLPCPWNHDDVSLTSNGYANEYVECHKCGASGPVCDTEAKAITAWNTRATQPARDSGLGEDARDAARYRWLRAQNSNTEDINAWTVTGCDFTYQEGPSQYWVGADLDAAIDAALAIPSEGELK